MNMRKLTACLSLLICCAQLLAQSDSTYAERLGFPKGARVVILHVDDAGMSYDSNEGVFNAISNGVAKSTSVMMPCPWVPGFVHWLKEHPNADAGLHLTLTSEWKDYRWSALSGKPKVPGLIDTEGAMWHSVEEVVKHASPDEVETEIRAQIDRSKVMGFQPTHMDSHMGTLFAFPAFTEKYIKLGIEYHIPIMFPGGHSTLIAQQMKSLAVDLQQARAVGKMLWSAGLPVIDDIENNSYTWTLPPGVEATDENLRKYKTQFYMNALKSVQPGITYVIMHCTATTEVFSKISDSGATRRGDLLAMTNPELKAFLEKEGIIVTTFRELSERRAKLK